MHQQPEEREEGRQASSAAATPQGEKGKTSFKGWLNGICNTVHSWYLERADFARRKEGFSSEKELKLLSKFTEKFTGDKIKMMDVNLRRDLKQEHEGEAREWMMSREKLLILMHLCRRWNGLHQLCNCVTFT